MAREDVVIRFGGTLSPTLQATVARVQSSVQAIKSSVFSLNGLLAGVGVGSIFATVLRNSEVQQQALKQVEASIRSTGGAAGYTTEELAAMASEFQQVTTFGDEATLSMQSVLLTFTNIGRAGGIFRDASRAVLDLSAKLGQSLQSAAIQVGKALNDPVKGITALQRVGVSFSAEQVTLIKRLAETNQLGAAQRIILDELNRQFGGSADIKTFGDQMTALGNAFGDLFENTSASAGGVANLTATLADRNVVAAFQQLTNLVLGLVNVLAQAAAGFVDFARHVGRGLAMLTTNLPDVENLAQAIVELEEKIARLEQNPRGGAARNQRLAALRAQLEQLRELEQNLADLAPPGAGAAAGGGTGGGGATGGGGGAGAGTGAAEQTPADKALAAHRERQRRAAEEGLSESRRQSREQAAIWQAYYAEIAALQEGRAADAEAAQAQQEQALQRLLDAGASEAAARYYAALVDEVSAATGQTDVPLGKVRITLDQSELDALPAQLQAAIASDTYTINLVARVTPVLTAGAGGEITEAADQQGGEP